MNEAVLPVMNILQISWENLKGP